MKATLRVTCFPPEPVPPNGFDAMLETMGFTGGTTTNQRTETAFDPPELVQPDWMRWGVFVTNEAASLVGPRVADIATWVRSWTVEVELDVPEGSTLPTPAPVRIHPGAVLPSALEPFRHLVDTRGRGSIEQAISLGVQGAVGVDLAACALVSAQVQLLRRMEHEGLLAGPPGAADPPAALLDAAKSVLGLLRDLQRNPHLADFSPSGSTRIADAEQLLRTALATAPAEDPSHA